MSSVPRKAPAFSRKEIVSGLALASFLLASSGNLLPTFAADKQPSLPETTPSETANSSVLIAQGADATLLLFTTDRFDVRVFQRGDQILMNVFDATFDISRLLEGPAQLTIQNTRRTYISTGSFAGRQARYEVSILSDQRAQLTIRDGSGNIIANELSTSISDFNIPTEQLEAAQDTVLRFETTTYSVHVFEREEGAAENNKFMNVFNKFTAATEVNGQAASLLTPEPPFQNAASYVASANRNGQPVEYVARIDFSGATILEILNINRQPIFRESGEGPATVNIPDADLAIIAAANNAAETDLNELNNINNDSSFIAAVFGGDETLDAVRSLFPDAFFVNARQGRFIHTGSFTSRDAASARVFELRSRGFSARVIFRDVDFR